MKRTVLILGCLMFMQLITGCYKTDDGTYTDPITIYEKVGGSWQLTKLIEVDEIAVASSITPDNFNLTREFDFRSFTLTLNVDENFQPTSYEVGGNAPELFAKSGFWGLSNPYPNTDGTAVKIQLYSDEAKTTLVDELSLASLPGTKATMEFNLTRISNGLPYVTYQYAVKLIEE